MTPGTRRNNILYIILILTFFCGSAFAQSWNFKLKSKVELRTWALSSKAEKHASPGNGASIKLYKGSSIITQTASDENGNFEMTIPSEGDYTLLIEYPGCDPKKFSVRTREVPANKNDVNFKPTIDIAGLMASKGKDGKYLGLDQTHIRIVNSSAKSSSNTSGQANKNFHFRQYIHDAEYLVIQKFCIANRLGDMALEKNNYELAQKFYLMASGIMGSESYPKDKLKIAEDGLKLAKAATKKNTRTTQVQAKQIIVADPKKSTDFKKSSDGKGRKIRKAL